MGPPDSVPAFRVREIGSFFAGGRTVTLSGQPVLRLPILRNGSERVVDLNGDYLTGQCYVQFVLQEAPRFGAPLMFWHGGAMTGVTWETTPDGRPGWQSFFMKAGFDTYVCDSVERGRASWSPYPQIYASAPIYRTQNEAWELFRFGDPGNYATDPAERRPLENSLFPNEALDTLGRQFVPRWADHGADILAAYYEALARVGPVWLIAHSQGGNFALEAAARHPELFKGIVAVEPASAPAGVEPSPAVPHLFVWGDHVERFPYWVEIRRTVERYAEALRTAGAPIETLDLPARGVRGNSHVPMMDRNSDAVAEMVLDWIRRQFKDSG